MRLILIRHGESVGNYENRLQGQEDYPLTEQGRRQAVLTARRLQALGTTAVYSSHLMRARETAVAIGERLGVAPVIREDLSEYHFGEMSGLTYAEIRERFGAIANPAERAYPGEEGRDNFFRRVTEALWGIAAFHQDETVAVVSHGGPIALFCQSILGLPYRRPMPFAISNCSLSIIEASISHPAASEAARRGLLLHLNDICHLDE